METWRSSLNRHPLDIVFKNGSREYMAEMNLKEKMSLTFKKIRNFWKNPKKRILKMKRLLFGQKPVLKYSFIGIICLVILLVSVKIVSCCRKAEISKNGYRKLENIDIENWNCSFRFEYKDNKICAEIIKWFVFSRSWWKISGWIGIGQRSKEAVNFYIFLRKDLLKGASQDKTFFDFKC